MFEDASCRTLTGRQSQLGHLPGSTPGIKLCPWMMLRERDEGGSRAMLSGFGGGRTLSVPLYLFLFQMVFPHPYSGFGSHGVGWRKHPINDGPSEPLQSLSLVLIPGHWCWGSTANACLGSFTGLCPVPDSSMQRWPAGEETQSLY